jgi:hypothetical protein
MQTSERWIVGTFLTVALLTFFFPLVTLQVPILGNQDISGYDFITKATEFNQSLDVLKSKEVGEQTSEASEQVRSTPTSQMSPSSMSLPVQTLPFVPIEIIASFACALIALCSCASPLREITKLICIFGSVAAAVSLLHLAIANSDLHTWLHQQMKTDSSMLTNNPFAGLSQQIGNLAVNSFQLKAGVGLYVFAASLLLATIVLQSRLLAATPGSTPAIVVSDVQSDGTGRIFGFLALIVVFAGLVIMLFNHKTPTTPLALAVRGDFSASKALTYLFGNYDPASKTSSVAITNEKGERSTGRSNLILDRPFSQGGEQKHLLVTSTAATGVDCHACDAGIGAYVFVSREGGWIAEITDNEIGRSGAWGDAGKAALVKFAPEVYGFSLRTDDMHQGEADSSEVFVAPVNGHFHPVLSLEIASDNAGNCGPTDPDSLPGHFPCVQSRSVVHFLDSVHHGFFDIRVDESGTTYQDMAVIPARRTTIYFFSGQKYAE